MLTCREMARGGLYDHLGGGFHRYSVDARWCVPHFEKMLYDQGQLLRTYSEAWRRSGASDDDLLWPVRETAAFLRREMRAPDGGWFASQDADSEGEEGRFYVWTPAQVARGARRRRRGVLRRLLGHRARQLRARHHGARWTACASRARSSPREREQLLDARRARIAPGTDRKRVTAWNALCISGLARAGSLLGDAEMLADAAAAADFLAERLVDASGRLLRIWNEGRAHVLAFLDDHAALLEANLDLFRAGAGERFLARALELAGAIASRFFDAGENDLFLTPSDGEPLAQRPRSDHDGATPHSTGLAVLGLLRAAADRGPRRPARRRAARAAHARGRARAHARGVPDPRARRAVRGARRIARARRGRRDDPATAALAARARRVLAPETR